MVQLFQIVGHQALASGLAAPWPWSAFTEPGLCAGSTTASPSLVLAPSGTGFASVGLAASLLAGSPAPVSAVFSVTLGVSPLGSPLGAAPAAGSGAATGVGAPGDRKSTRLNSSH